MRTHSKIVLAAVGGILASCLAFQSPGQAQKVAGPSNTATRDCQFLLDAYWDVMKVSLTLHTATGERERLSELKELSAFWNLIPESEYRRHKDLIHQKFREANPELKSIWDSYQDCLTKQQQAERLAREKVVPPPPVKTKIPETPPVNADDVIWDILMRVRTAPDPEKELKLTDEEAVAWVTAMLEATEVQEPTDKPRKPRKRTRTGGDGEETTQTHDPGTSTAMIMLLGTAAGAAADRLRQRGSGGGGGGGGGTPVKPGSGGCTGGVCRR